MSLIWREGQLNVSAIHLGSSLSQAEEQVALFAVGGPVKILVELNRAGGVASPGDGSAKMATSVGGGELQTAQFPIGRSAKRKSVLIGRRQPVRPAGAPAQQILITTNIQVNF